MAIPTDTIMKLLPKNTYIRCGMMNTFCHRGFFMTRMFINLNPRFDWERHIDDTFKKCMKPMTDRMMRVV